MNRNRLALFTGCRSRAVWKEVTPLDGNGGDNPVPGMTDPSNAEHNKKNRRVEVKVFPLEKE